MSASTPRPMLVMDCEILNSSPVIEVRYGVATGANVATGTCGSLAYSIQPPSLNALVNC